MPKFIFLWTDLFIFCLVLAIVGYAVHVTRSPALKTAWRSVGRSASAMSAAVVLACFLLIGVLDSIHYRPQLPAVPTVAGQVDDAQSESAAAGPVYSPVARSLLDDLLSMTQLNSPEATYSEPLAVRQFTKETRLIDGQAVRDFPRLKHAGTMLVNEQDRGQDQWRRVGYGAGWGALAALLAAGLLTLCHWRRAGSPAGAWRMWWSNASGTPWRAVWLTAGIVAIVAGTTLALAMDYHVLGTDRTGNDVLRQSLKSVRTALVIGTLTTVAMLPPALIFGISAGYFKGRVDDAVQYLYTTLTSIPGVLLIAACVLMMQVYIDTNPGQFPTVAARADLRLFLLCLILGLTGWSGLCRLLRAETLKLRELEYIQAARAFGVSHWRIMARHVLPNLMHIVLITAVLEFSGLVLYEAVLSYLGIGVDPTTASFGSMIDAARMEMSRDPMIWWNLLAAFAFMLALVLSANIFADAVQAAFDPRARRFLPRMSSAVLQTSAVPEKDKI